MSLRDSGLRAAVLALIITAFPSETVLEEVCIHRSSANSVPRVLDTEVAMDTTHPVGEPAVGGASKVLLPTKATTA